MKFISTKVHGILDYLTGSLLIILPLIYKGNSPGIATYTLVIAGALILVMSFFTNYELGIVRKISIINHQMADKTLGVLLAISPWVLGFDDVAYAPHLIVGFISIAVPTFTKKITTTTQIERKEAGEVTKSFLGQP